jgi:hypothetical protein
VTPTRPCEAPQRRAPCLTPSRRLTRLTGAPVRHSVTPPHDRLIRRTHTSVSRPPARSARPDRPATVSRLRPPGAQSQDGAAVLPLLAPHAGWTGGQPPAHGSTSHQGGSWCMIHPSGAIPIHLQENQWNY